MYTKSSKSKISPGFTIVELLIVIVVVAILAAITIVSYSGIRERAERAAVESALSTAAKKMELFAIHNGEVYPSSIPSEGEAEKNVDLSLSQTDSNQSFCINGTYKDTSITMHIDSRKGSIAEGSCSGEVIADPGEKPTPVVTNLLSSPESASSWSLSASGGSKPFTSRSGTASDPFPSRPVIIYENNTAVTSSWGYFKTPVNTSEIKAGQSYTASFWVRKVGAYNGNTYNGFGVMDGNMSNRSLPLGGTTPATGTWTKMSRTSNALMDALTSNTLYLPVTASQLSSTGWSLEFQAVELIQN